MTEDLNEETLNQTLALLREAMERGEVVRKRIIGLHRAIDGQLLSFITKEEQTNA